jgi:hypothetical protein
MPALQLLPQGRECRRQLPAAQHRRVIQRRRPTPQRRQVVQRVQDLLVAAIAAGVARHHLARGHHLDVVDVPLDRHGAEGVRPRHAVAVAVELDRLILVYLGRLEDAGVEGARR